MKQRPPYIICDSNITIVVGGKPYTISSNNASFAEVKNRIANEDFDSIENLFDKGAAVGVYTKGNIVVKDGEVLYKGDTVHNHVVDRIFDFMRQGLPYKPLVNFLDKLLQNPSRRATQELYSFLEHKNMPLTPDGNFLAYKSVKSDYTDHRTGQFLNTVGSVLEMIRNEVCDNADIGCSFGFHAGSLKYAQSFGEAGSVLLIVEINPSDVVSIPKDCDCQKLRTWRYKVVGTFERPLSEPLISQYEDSEESGVNTEIFYEEGYKSGKEDAELGLVRNAEEAFSNVEAHLLNEYDETDFPSFIEGYQDGFDENCCRLSKKAISDSTRNKLRQAAFNQKRDSNGKFC